MKELRIRRTHADLRSDAICMENGVCIFDAVEFSRRVSLLDIARDVGFLQMDLEYRDRPDLADAFVRRYEKIADDPDLREVLPFYAYYSACVRGKVEAFLLDIPSVPAKEKKAAAERSRRYFELACRYAETLPPALLVITCGLSGSGKSTVAREISAAIDGEIIASDVVRKRLAGMDPAKRALDEYRAGLYSAEMSKQTLREDVRAGARAADARQVRRPRRGVPPASRPSHSRPPGPRDRRAVRLRPDDRRRERRPAAASTPALRRATPPTAAGRSTSARSATSNAPAKSSGAPADNRHLARDEGARA